MARYPVSARRTMVEPFSGETLVSLLTFTHADLAAPIRLSSDPTQRLSSDPLVYGTISNGVEYQFVFMTVTRPDDEKGAPPRFTISFDNIDATFVELAQSFSTPATLDMEEVFASAPDTVINSASGFSTTNFRFDDSTISFDVSREPFIMEPHGSRMTKIAFPGLHGIDSA